VDPKYKNAGIALGGLAVVALVIALVTDGSSTPTCGLTSAAAGAIIIGVTQGKETAAIVGTAAGGVVVPAVCKPVVDALINKPDEDVKLEVQLPDGGESAETLKGSQLPSTLPAPEQRSCLNWILDEWKFLCLQGKLPPVAPPA
jgi:hypothetical protein